MLFVLQDMLPGGRSIDRVQPALELHHRRHHPCMVDRDKGNLGVKRFFV